MTIKLFADGADLDAIRRLAADPRIAGFTTNPTLVRRAGHPRYRAFITEALRTARSKPVSVEVLHDDEENLLREARGIVALGKNAVVKVPVVDSRGQALAGAIAILASEGVPLNVTAVFTVEQVQEVGRALSGGKPGRRRINTSQGPPAPAIVSVFAGRIADAGVDPLAHVTACREVLREACPRAEMLWASPRQVYDVALAERAGCEVITMTPDLIDKMVLRGKDLAEYSRETAAQFARDAQEAGYEL